MHLLCSNSKMFIKHGMQVCILFGCLSNIAHSEPIQADRPGFSTGTYTVDPGVTHLEFGFQSSYGKGPTSAGEFTAPLINIRAGITSDTELNILADGWTLERNAAQNGTYAQDVLVGIKHRLVASDKYNISVLGYISLPIGNEQGGAGFSPFIGLLWDYSLTQSVSAFGTVQVISSVTDYTRSTNFQPAIGLSFAHSKKISTYVEYYSDISLNLNNDHINTIDAGIAYLLTDDIQLDFNFGVSDDSDAHKFIGAGMAVRF